MIEFTTKQVIELSDWDGLVEETYGKPYRFQQQDGCQPRGTRGITVPDPYAEDYENDTLPEVVNHPERGVSLKAWLTRDPEQQLEGSQGGWQTRMWWDRNFYPSLETVANDLHAKGLIPAGEYTIDIDW